MADEEVLDCAIEAVKAASVVIRRDFRLPLRVRAESAHDIKLETDVEAQAAIEKVILDYFPGAQIVGEESEGNRVKDDDGVGVKWIVDPLDGTVNFSYRIPHFCVSVAAQVSRRVVCGVIYDPIRDELFTARLGKGAYLNGERIRVSERGDLSEAAISIGFARREETISHTLKLYEYYGLRVKKLRAMGAAALDLAYVAAGRLDAYMEQEVSWWDVAAGILLVQEAGGRVEWTERANGKIQILADSGHLDFRYR